MSGDYIKLSEEYLAADVIKYLVRPRVMVHCREEIRAANGRIIIHANSSVCLRIRREDSFGCEIEVYDTHDGNVPCGYVGPGDLDGKVRGLTFEEELAFIKEKGRA